MGLNGYTPDFLEFWQLYPNKKAKIHCYKTWLKLKKEKLLPELPELRSALQEQKKERQFLMSQDKFVPCWKHPATWLNAGCWEDECELPEYTEILTPEQKRLRLIGKA